MTQQKTGLNKKKALRKMHRENYYQKRFFITEKNKDLAWKRHLELHPNDLKAIDNIKSARGMRDKKYLH